MRHRLQLLLIYLQNLMVKSKNIRTPISKKLRFEVFKRDKFACNYCGKQAPNVVLEIDHIEPVSKGGTNEILNLITSCYDCNRGKSNIKIDDDSAISKQRTQLEILQDRREQIELMFQWKKSLSDLDEDVVKMLSEYISGKIGDFTLNENGLKTVKSLIKQFELADVLESVDIAADKYLLYDNDGNLDKDSVEDFISKIGGITANKNRPLIDQKISYVKGICRNSFNYWDDRKGSIILNEYITALKNYGWSDEQILSDLENELIPKTKECSNWSQWRNLIEGWTSDISSWEKEEIIDEISDHDLQQYAEELYEAKKMVLPTIIFVSQKFGKNIDENEMGNYLEDIIEMNIRRIIDDKVFSLKKYQEYADSGLFCCGPILTESGIFDALKTKENYDEKTNNIRKGLLSSITFLIEDRLMYFLNRMFNEYEFTNENYLLSILEKYRKFS